MKVRYITIIDVLLAFIICSYAGPFASYITSLTFIGFVFVISLLMIATGKMKRNNLTLSLSWKFLLIYLIVNSLLNIPYSILYLLLLFMGIILLIRVYDDRSITIITNVLKIVSIFLACSIFAQAYFPTLFYKFAKLWFFYSNQFDLVYSLGEISHQYSGIFYEVSFSAVILAVGIGAFFADIIINHKSYTRNIILLVILYYAVFLTGKRSFILIIPFVLAIFFLISNIEKLTIWRLLLITLGLGILAWFSGDILTTVMTILDKGDTTIQLSSRERYWNLALSMLFDRPLLGKGLNSFDIAFNQSGIKSGYYAFAGAHNSYIQLLAETGIVGIVLYMFCVLKTFFNGLKCFCKSIKTGLNNENYTLFFALVSIVFLLVYGISGNVFHQPQQLVCLFFLLGLIRNQQAKMN